MRRSVSLCLWFALTACRADPATVDLDGDGAYAALDCDDTDATVFPGAEERCDLRDNDCDGTVDVDAVDALPWFEDFDGDGFGDPDAKWLSCSPATGQVGNSGDCDDHDPLTHPGALEDSCIDALDRNCDGSVADDDADGDGVVACDDCDDGDPDVGVARLFALDGDGDGYGGSVLTSFTCFAPEGFVVGVSDCDDFAAGVHPGATEVCDGRDQDCNGLVDDGVVDAPTWYYDADGDGWGNAVAVSQSCAALPHYVGRSGDCDDTDASISPSAVEVRGDGVDQDCDGVDAPLPPYLGDLTLSSTSAMTALCSQHDEVVGTLTIYLSGMLNPDLQQLACLRAVRGSLVLSGTSTSTLELPELQAVDGIIAVSGSHSGALRLPALTGLGGLLVESGSRLGAFEAASLEDLAWLQVYSARLDALELPSLRSAGALQLSAVVGLSQLSLPALTAADELAVVELMQLTGIDAPQLSAVSRLGIAQAPLLAGLRLPSLAMVDELFLVDLPALQSLSEVDASSTPQRWPFGEVVSTGVPQADLGPWLRARGLPFLDDQPWVVDSQAEADRRCAPGPSGKPVHDGSVLIQVDAIPAVSPAPPLVIDLPCVAGAGSLQVNVQQPLTLSLPALSFVTSDLSVFSPGDPTSGKPLPFEPDLSTLRYVGSLSWRNTRTTAVSLPALRGAFVGLEWGELPDTTALRAPLLESAPRFHIDRLTALTTLEVPLLHGVQDALLTETLLTPSEQAALLQQMTAP